MTSMIKYVLHTMNLLLQLAEQLRGHALVNEVLLVEEFFDTVFVVLVLVVVGVFLSLEHSFNAFFQVVVERLAFGKVLAFFSEDFLGVFQFLFFVFVSFFVFGVFFSFGFFFYLGVFRFVFVGAGVGGRGFFFSLGLLVL